jgi:hypothetical protein
MVDQIIGPARSAVKMVDMIERARHPKAVCKLTSKQICKQTGKLYLEEDQIREIRANAACKQICLLCLQFATKRKRRKLLTSCL